MHSGETVAGDLLGTAEADQITVEEGGWVMGFVSGEGGDDYIVNNGNISDYLVGFELGEGGSPTVINNGMVWAEMVGADSGPNDSDVVLVENNGEVLCDVYGGFNSRGTFTVKKQRHRKRYDLRHRRHPLLPLDRRSLQGFDLQLRHGVRRHPRNLHRRRQCLY